MYDIATYGCMLLCEPPSPVLSVSNAAQSVMLPDMVQAVAAWSPIATLVDRDPVAVLVPLNWLRAPAVSVVPTDPLGLL